MQARVRALERENFMLRSVVRNTVKAAQEENEQEGE